MEFLPLHGQGWWLNQQKIRRQRQSLMGALAAFLRRIQLSAGCLELPSLASVLMNFSPWNHLQRIWVHPVTFSRSKTWAILFSQFTRKRAQRWKVWPVQTAAPELRGCRLSPGKKGDDNGEPHPAARGGLDLSLFQTHQIPFDGTRVGQWQVKHSDLQDQKLFHKLTLSSPGCGCLRELLVNAMDSCVVGYPESQTKMRWDISSISNNVSQTCYTFFKTESGSTSLLQRLW